MQNVLRDGFFVVSEYGVGWDPEVVFRNPENYSRYKQEYEKTVSSHLQTAKRRHYNLTGHEKFAGLNRFTPHRLYAMIRDRNPSTVVETGVCNGSSALVILSALQKNDYGRLYSVDVPNREKLAPGREPGWIIPDELRDRWDLRLGDSCDHLPEITDESGAVDVFLHDSTVIILLDEIGEIWPSLDRDGIMIADDIHHHHGDRAYESVLESFPVRGGYLAPDVAVFVPER
jgi:predicted O-methyltransferase YrrM